VILKSLVGLPNPKAPHGVVLAVEERKARGRLMPVTLLYGLYTLVILGFCLVRFHVGVAVSFFVAGVAVWTIVEYLVHRYILHGRFPDGKGFSHLLHIVFDPMHSEHHERPWDGNHINGHVDTVPVAAVLILLSFVTSFYKAPVFVAGLLFSYVVEEWIHHAVHFYHFRSRYFRYIRRHHLYHHSPKGSEVAYGLTNGFWDIIYQTRISAVDRRLLYGPASSSRVEEETSSDRNSELTSAPH